MVINDNLNDFSNYTVAAIKFIQDYVMHKAGDNDDEKLDKNKVWIDNSMHFDFWIIPESVINTRKLSKKTKKESYKSSKFYEKHILNNKDLIQYCSRWKKKT
eukprot:523421_1